MPILYGNQMIKYVRKIAIFWEIKKSYPYSDKTVRIRFLKKIMKFNLRKWDQNLIANNYHKLLY